MPPGLWKAEISHTFSPNFFMTAKWASYDTGFGLVPRGGTDDTYTIDYIAGEAIGSYETYLAIRPQKTFAVDGNYFFSGLGGNNELKFGFGYRSATTNSVSSYSGTGLSGYINGPGDSVAIVHRDANTYYGGKYTSAYVGDVLTKNRFTANVGVRYDRQTAENLESSVPANKAFPTLLPGITFTGSNGNIIEWGSLSPRVGLSYALDESRKTILRASYSNYAQQLSFGDAAIENPVALSYLAYAWNDANADRKVQPGEVNLGSLLYYGNVDPINPGSVSATPNKVDRGLKPKRDYEFILGLDREMGANVAIGFAYTYRKGSEWSTRYRLAGACSGDPTFGSCPTMGPGDYTQNATSTANGFSAFTYSPNAALVSAGQSGRLYTNRNGYHTTFNGLELTLNKRLANRWMGRVAFSYNDWTEHFDGTPQTANLARGNPGRTEQDPLVEGGQVAFLSGGSGKASFYSSTKWQIYANALVQLGWGFDLSGAVFSKQGGAYPVSLRISAGRDGTIPSLSSPEVDSTRLNTVLDFDLRLAKNIKLGGTTLTLSAEAFNVFNSGVVLSRYRYANSSSFTATVSGAEAGMGRIEEVLTPRIIRFGVRYQF